MHIILETPRLYLRCFANSEEDAALIYTLNSDAEVLRYLHEPVLRDTQHAREILQNIILPQYNNRLGRWATHLKQNNEFIGWCGLKYRPELGETDLGYRLKKAAWGNGYASEAATACLSYAFTSLGIHSITGRAHVDNTASLIILQKIGMKYVKDEVIDCCPVKTFVAFNSVSQKFVKEK